MSPEEEEAVQAELEALQREALVRRPEKGSSLGKQADSSSPLCRSIPNKREWSCPTCQYKSPVLQNGHRRKGRGSKKRVSPSLMCLRRYRF